MDDLTPMAVEHDDGVEPNPVCENCGAPKELVMLERFTGWWCRDCPARRPAENPVGLGTPRV